MARTSKRQSDGVGFDEGDASATKPWKQSRNKPREDLTCNPAVSIGNETLNLALPAWIQ